MSVQNNGTGNSGEGKERRERQTEKGVKNIWHISGKVSNASTIQILAAQNVVSQGIYINPVQAPQHAQDTDIPPRVAHLQSQ